MNIVFDGWPGSWEDELLVSFDVSSLFTNVPIDKAVQVIRHRLTQADTLAGKTTLALDQVAELLDVCLRSTYFSYGGDFYKQQEGAAMGSPVSAAVANLYMGFFEDLALTQAPDECRPRIWKRYIHDTFCILHSEERHFEKLLSHLNSLCPTIQVTVEVGKDGSLPVLDILLRRKDDGSLDAMVYRKPTHTDRYLGFQSHHAHHVERGMVRCLHDRAWNITSSQENLNREEHHIATILKQNGYPAYLVIIHQGLQSCQKLFNYLIN